MEYTQPQQRASQALYIMATELLDLPPGIHRPDVPGFEHYALRSFAHSHGGIKIVVNDKIFFLRKDDTLRLSIDGYTHKILGPSNYPDPIEAAVAGATFSVKRHLEYRDQWVEVNPAYGETASVMTEGNKWQRADANVPANYGKLVVVYTAQPPTKYFGFYIRNAYRNDPDVINFMTEFMKKRQRQPSGVFEQVIREYWEPWLKRAAQEYYAALDRKSAATHPVTTTNDKLTAPAQLVAV